MKKRSSESFNRKEGTRTEKPSLDKSKNISFSFKYLDETQPKIKPETIESWDSDGFSLKFIQGLKNLCKLTFREAEEQKQITIYKDNTIPDGSYFEFPKNIPNDIQWVAIKKIFGQQPRIIGFIEDDIFQIVLLDKNHKFWPTDR